MSSLFSKWQGWRASIWRVVGGVSIQTKILGMVLVSVAVLGLAVTVEVRTTIARALREQLQQQSISVARDVAARSVDLVLTNDLYALHRLLGDTQEHNPDVRYAFVVGSDGQVLAHTFDNGFPVDLLTANALSSDGSQQLQSLRTGEGTVWDTAVPIFEGRAGVARVGLSERAMQATLNSITQQVLTTTALILLVGVAAAMLLTWLITRPVLDLVEVTRAVARGDLSRMARRWSDDEIGLLSDSFNAMVGDLAAARAESEAYNAELLRRNRELAVLNEIAQVVSRQPDLGEMLDNALRRVLGLMKLEAGWILLLGANGREPRLACSVGLPELVTRKEALGFPKCKCSRVLEEKGPLCITQLDDACPVRGLRLGDGQVVAGHVVVPLISKSQVLGILNIAFVDPDRFSNEDLQLLGAIGRQLGVAVENASLWEQVRQKEVARGQLLEKIITAQEEERKRIARELHDETGQALASLMVGLRNVEEAPTPEELGQRLHDLRGVLSRTLNRVRRLAFDLRPSVLDDLGLVAALCRYAQQYQERFGIMTEVQTMGIDGKRLTPETETTVYRIVQEAMSNAARYADCGHISVLVQIRDGQLFVIVEDDGCGFDIERVWGDEVGQGKLGLYGMQERAELIGGQLDVESQPGSSTTIYLRVPLDDVHTQ